MNTSLELFTAHAEAIGWALLHSLWQGASVAAALFVTLGVLRRRSAAVRHVACLLALLALVAAVAVTLVRTDWPALRKAGPITSSATIASIPARVPSATLPVEPGIVEFPSQQTPSILSNTESQPFATARPASWRERLEPWMPALSVLWAVGVLLGSLRRLGGCWRVHSWRQSGEPARPELQRALDRLRARFGLPDRVRLLETADAVTPMLAGALKPVVLLPARVITGLSAAELEAILAHELAHLARGDAWSNLAQLVVETLFFYHPAVWWIGHRARQEREHAADDLALRVCTDRRLYAGALTRLAEMQLVPSLAPAATGGNLLARIRRIVRPDAPETTTGGWSFVVLVPLLLTFASVTWSARVQADDAKPVPPPAPSETARQTEARATENAKPWIADAFQLDDTAKRAAAIARIRAAMTSGNVEEARTGITAFTRLGSIEFDKASFRPAVRTLLASGDVTTRAKAAGAFTMTGAEPEDLPRIFALADDPAPEVRDNLTAVIVQLTNRDLRDKAASDAILKLMANLPRDSRNVAHAIWGVKLSPEIEARVLEFCREIDHASNSSVGYNFFYGTLSTQANKSEASCKRLIELLAHQDTTNIAGRSAWGLQQGVDRAQFPLVANAMMKVIESRSDGYLRNNALRCLQTYGSAAQAAALRALLEKPGVTGEFRATLEQTLAAIEQRPAVQATASSPPPATTAPAQVVAEKPEIEVEWKGKWWPATVLKKEGERTQIHYIGYGSEWDEWVTAERIRPVSTAAAPNDAASVEAAKIAQMVEKNRQAARARGMEDRQRYTPEQLQEIETLYQVANTKGKRNPEAVASLKQLLEKYDKANRTGCATLYLGQASEGAERLEYLTRAVEKFSDCYYYNGCQVGGYGRYVLALTLWEKGEKDKARALIGELKTTYKDATGHNGRPMSEFAESAEKSFAEAK